MRRRAALLSLFTLSLSIVSTTFVLLALTSNRWSVQKYYYNPTGGQGSGADWTTPVCIANKSPFYRCDAPFLTDESNASTCLVQNCNWYRPSGWNKTSCRVPVEVGGLADATGDYQECQEVHYTGYLQIAASVFITLGLILLIPLTTINLLLSLGPRRDYDLNGPRRDEPGRDEPGRDESAPSNSEFKTPTSHHRPVSHHHHPLSPFAPYIVLLTIIFLCVGAVLQIIAQFFGVLSMTLNATPTVADAESNADQFLGATPWIIDTALSAYATVAWTFAVGCAGFVGVVYRGVRVEKFL